MPASSRCASLSSAGPRSASPTMPRRRTAPGAQLADRWRYRALQAGGGAWVVVFRSMGLAAGVEALARAGQLAGEDSARTAWAVIFGLGALDKEGYAGGAAYLYGSGQGLP